MAAEAQLQNLIMDWLAAKHVLAFRMNTGIIKIEKRYVRFGVLGMADILVLPRRWRECLGCNRDRLHLEPVWIEVKAPNGCQSGFQKSFQKQVEGEGHLYILAKSLADVEAVLG